MEDIDTEGPTRKEIDLANKIEAACAGSMSDTVLVALAMVLASGISRMPVERAEVAFVKVDALLRGYSAHLRKERGGE